MLISVITVNYNNKAGLERTLQSLYEQSFSDFEVIVIDGGSTDGSRLVIESNNLKIAFWVSEKDNGIYHAMNKGIHMARGRFLFFLNSGDVLYNNAVFKNVEPYLSNSELIYGNLMISEPVRNWEKKYNEPLSVEYFTRDTLPHQGSFIDKTLFERIGLYDESLKIVADWKFFLEAVCIYNVNTLYVDSIISYYDYTGLSSRPEFYALQAKEKRTVLSNLFPMYIDSIYELHTLREKKNFYDSFSNDFLVQKYFALKLKWRAVKKRFFRQIH